MTRPAKVLSVLFVGNSFTSCSPYDMPGMLCRMSARRPAAALVRADCLAQDGASLQDHWDSGRFSAALAGRGWDFVVLQDYSRQPLEDAGLFEDCLRRCDGLIRAGGSRTVLFSTWLGRGQTGGDSVSAAYLQAGKALGAAVAEVGAAWRRAAVRGIELYGPDGEHPGPRGAYLTACIFYALLCGADPAAAGLREEEGLLREDLDVLWATRPR